MSCLDQTLALLRMHDLTGDTLAARWLRDGPCRILPPHDAPSVKGFLRTILQVYRPPVYGLLYSKGRAHRLGEKLEPWTQK